MNNHNQSPAFNQAVTPQPTLYEFIPNKSGTKVSVKLHLPFGTRYIGYIQDGTYCKNVNMSRHQFNKYPSIAFCLDLLENEKFTWIKVECDDGRILETSRKFVLINGKRQTFSKAGYERQVFLSLHLFSREEALKFERIEERKPVITQMNLFS